MRLVLVLRLYLVCPAQDLFSLAPKISYAYAGIENYENIGEGRQDGQSMKRVELPRDIHLETSLTI